MQLLWPEKTNWRAHPTRRPEHHEKLAHMLSSGLVSGRRTDIVKHQEIQEVINPPLGRVSGRRISAMKDPNNLAFLFFYFALLLPCQLELFRKMLIKYDQLSYKELSLRRNQQTAKQILFLKSVIQLQHYFLVGNLFICLIIIFSLLKIIFYLLFAIIYWNY